MKYQYPTPAPLTGIYLKVEPQEPQYTERVESGVWGETTSYQVPVQPGPPITLRLRAGQDFPNDGSEWELVD